MLHAFCDFCGKYVKIMLLWLNYTFGNFDNNHNSKDIYGRKDKSKSFVICQNYYKNIIKLPNPYE